MNFILDPKGGSNRVRSGICSSFFSVINWHWWNPKGMISCKYLPPFQEEWQVTCVQLSSGFLDLCTLQVTRTHSVFKYHGSSWCLDEYKLLSDRQHAFRKGHSCETQLTTVINDWAKILDNRGQVDTFILDFEKAFDNPFMNSLKANYLAMELVIRHWNG